MTSEFYDPDCPTCQRYGDPIGDEPRCDRCGGPVDLVNEFTITAFGGAPVRRLAWKRCRNFTDCERAYAVRETPTIVGSQRVAYRHDTAKKDRTAGRLVDTVLDRLAPDQRAALTDADVAEICQWLALCVEAA